MFVTSKEVTTRVFLVFEVCVDRIAVNPQKSSRKIETTTLRFGMGIH